MGTRLQTTCFFLLAQEVSINANLHAYPDSEDLFAFSIDFLIHALKIMLATKHFVAKHQLTASGSPVPELSLLPAPIFNNYSSSPNGL